jgi:hypothetical protein
MRALLGSWKMSASLKGCALTTSGRLILPGSQDAFGAHSTECIVTLTADLTKSLHLSSLSLSGLSSLAESCNHLNCVAPYFAFQLCIFVSVTRPSTCVESLAKMTGQEKDRNDKGKGKGKGKEGEQQEVPPPRTINWSEYDDNEIMLMAARGKLPEDHPTDPQHRDDRYRHRLSNYEYRPGECPDDDDAPFIYTSAGIISRPTAKGIEPVDPAPTVKRFKGRSAFWASKHSEIPDYTPQPKGCLGKIPMDTVVKIRFRGADREVEVDLEGTVADFKKRVQGKFRVPANSILGRGQRELEDTEIVKDCDIELDEVVVVEERMQKFVHQAVKPRNSMTVFIKSLISQQYELEVPSFATVRMLKEFLASLAKLPVKILALQHNGKFLDDDDDVLQDMNIRNKAVLNLSEDAVTIAVRWFDNCMIHFALSQLNVWPENLFLMPVKNTILDLKQRLGAACGLFPTYQSLTYEGRHLDDKVALNSLTLVHGDEIFMKLTPPKGTPASPFESLPAWQPPWAKGEDPPSNSIRFIRKVQLDPSRRSKPYVINIAKHCYLYIMDLAKLNPDLELEEYCNLMWRKWAVLLQLKDVVAVFVHAGKLIPHAVVDGQLQLRMGGYEGDLVPTLSIPLFPASTESRLQEG